MRYYRLYEIDDARAWAKPIRRALEQIKLKCGGQYPVETVFEHLAKRLRGREFVNSLWLFMDREKLATGEPPDAVVALVTLDICHDEIGLPLTFISRAWAEPGVGKELWHVAKPAIEYWGSRNNCVGLIFQTVRDTAFAKWLEADGFVMRETNFVRYNPKWAQ